MNGAISGVRIVPAEVENTRLHAKSGTGSGFGEVLRGAVEETNALQLSAEQQVEQMMRGNGADVHQAMVAVEKADLSFQLMMQVRNKMVQAYQEISRLQF
ncbi:MAG TPA: flagellar hook-basal body complex protein FliE [Terriglobales bacterium]|nr:flagellar hook-basal body complex protein FliE [Terriglobales bacterium]